MQIVIKEMLLETLAKLATENELTSEEYASNLVNSFLEGQYRASVLDKIKLAPVEDLKVLKTEELATLRKIDIKPIK